MSQLKAPPLSLPPPVGEAELLLQMKRAWGDPPVLSAWSAATSATGAHCRWPYVRCDSVGRVTSLALTSISITGPLPDAIGGLSSLTGLDLFNNSIIGAFPKALYRCTSLRYLNLSENFLAGVLPRDIGHGLAANLSRLDLSFNFFNGTIPESLSWLENLRYLALDSNGIVGVMLTSLSRLRNLGHLTLRFNYLTGAIPAELGELASLQTLWLAVNPFDPGELPASFKTLTQLISLAVESCNLVGAFPSYALEKISGISTSRAIT
ncbi:unnamed protein product [Miscanthus lutarioriparius]|uniref:Leucine-rich repeat-containing N-terminal plant-type domain-containing protein n=1 Tax=Miscanthus lutarioriparius TaxID=422564 RepID=A0A811R7S0_9POAL|nr:unnamed protein product [Miscanthus lutarioriparius]